MAGEGRWGVVLQGYKVGPSCLIAAQRLRYISPTVESLAQARRDKLEQKRNTSGTMTTLKGISFMLLAVLPAAILAKVAEYPLPAYLTACHRKDPKFHDCIVKGGEAIEHFSKGDPKYRIPMIDPFVIPELRIKQGSNQIGMSFACNNCSLIGLKETKFLKAQSNMDQRWAEWTFFLKNLAVRGKYVVTGKVLLLPITGNGNADVNIKDLNVVYRMSWDLNKKSNGKEYIKVNNYTVKHDVGGLTIQLENLFNGDKLLGGNMNRFLNENWQELVKELGPAVANALGGILKSILNGMSDLIPYENLFPA